MRHCYGYSVWNVYKSRLWNCQGAVPCNHGVGRVVRGVGHVFVFLDFIIHDSVSMSTHFRHCLQIVYIFSCQPFRVLKLLSFRTFDGVRACVPLYFPACFRWRVCVRAFVDRWRVHRRAHENSIPTGNSSQAPHRPKDPHPHPKKQKRKK